MFDVVYATRTAAVTRNIHVKATRTYLIVYAFPNAHGSWKILEVIPPHDTVAERLDALLEKLNTNLTDLIGTLPQQLPPRLEDQLTLSPTEKKHEAQQIEQAKRDEHNAYCESRGMGHWVH